MNRKPLARHLVSGFAAVLGLAAAQWASAQAYPGKPVRIISTFQPGVIDAPLRAMTQKMAENIGQPVIVDVRASAGGVLAAQTLLRSDPDGHTLLFSSPNTVVTTPFLLKDRPYEPSDFTPITAIIGSTLCIMVAASFPPGSVRELIDYIKAHPGKLAYASNGVGGSYHLLMELIKVKHGLDITHVPYKGGNLAMLAAVAGQVPIAFSPVATALPHVKSGKLRILAVLDTRRSPSFPDIPSLSEHMPDYEPTPGNMWMYGPKGMTVPLVNRVHAELTRAVHSPEAAEQLRKIGFFPLGTPPEESTAQMKKDVEISLKALKAAQIQPE